MKCFFSLLLIFVCFFVSGQDYTFRLNGNTIAPKQIYDAQLRSAVLNDTLLENGYCIAQFYQIPTMEEQEALKKQGVSFVNFLQGTAYYVHLSNGVDLGAVGKKLVRAIVPIIPAYKVDSDIVLGNIPSYARVAGDFIQINVSCFYTVDSAIMAENLYLLGAQHFRKTIFGNQISVVLPIGKIDALSKLTWVKSIQLAPPPAEVENTVCVHAERANVLRSATRGLGYSLSGKGIRIGVWDNDVENHTDFGDRVRQREYEMHDSNHGTHVTGTIAGAGIIDPQATGVAPKARIYSHNFNTQSNMLAVPEERFMSLLRDSIELTSNSWGLTVTTCPNKLRYNNADMYEDVVANNFPHLLYIFSAGNDQSVCGDGYKTTSKNLKNSLVVAAVDRYDTLSSFSSCGPAYDGRLLPNISSDGVSVYSTVFENSYGFMSGTSMATPAVTGVMALLYERYKCTHVGELPLSSLMRALACNTARDLGKSGPDFRYGYGLINGSRAIEVMENQAFFTGVIGQSMTERERITVPENAVGLKVMLAWTDSAAVYGVDKTLVNNLDLTLTMGTQTYQPWVLDPDKPNETAKRGVDNLNNMEQITIDNPVAGSYLINVRGKSVPGGQQTYAVVYDVIMPMLKITYPIDSEKLQPGEEVIVRWDCEGYSLPFDLEYSTDNGETYQLLASDISASKRHYAFTLPEELRVAKGRFRISAGTNFDVSDVPFSVMSTPKDLRVNLTDSSALSAYELCWSPVNNATYEVLKLNADIYEHFGYTTDTTFALMDLKPSSDNMFTVRAIDSTTKTVSQRAYAVFAKVMASRATLPFFEDFEKQRSLCFGITKGACESKITFAHLAQGYGLVLSGLQDNSDWKTGPCDSLFNYNPDFVSCAKMVPIAVPERDSSPVVLSFDLYQMGSEPTSAQLRIRVNGQLITDDNNRTVLFEGGSEAAKRISLELSDYIDNETLNVEFETVCKTNYNRYTATDKGDFFFIDNIAVEKSKIHALVESVEVNDSASVMVTVNNVSGVNLAGIEMWCVVDSVKGTKLSLRDTLRVSDQLTCRLQLPTNLQPNTISNVTCFARTEVNNWPDTISYQTQLTIDNTLRMGGADSATVTDSLLFTDSGGLLDCYKRGEDFTITFYPDSSPKCVGILFDALALNKASSTIYIYNGESSSSPRMAVISKGEANYRYVSSDCSGALTVRFKAGNIKPTAGWISTIFLEDKKPDLIQIDTVVVDAGRIATQVINCGCNTFDAYVVAHQLNDSTPIMDSVVHVLAPLEVATDTLMGQLPLNEGKIDTLGIWAYVPPAKEGAKERLVTYIENGRLATDVEVDFNDLQISKFYVLPRLKKQPFIGGLFMNNTAVPVTGVEVGYIVNKSDTVSQIISETIAPETSCDFDFDELPDFSDKSKTYTVEGYLKYKDVTKSWDTSISFRGKAETNRVIAFNSNNFTSINALAHPDVNLGHDFTLEFWLHPKKVEQFGYFFYSSCAFMGYNTVGYGNSKENSIILGVKVNGDWARLYVSDALEMNRWQHVAFTATGKDYKLYIDGVEHDFALVGGEIAAIAWQPDARISYGGSHYGTYCLHGFMDEIRLWNYCRTPNQLRADALTDFTENTAGMMAYYPIDAAESSFIYDYSSADNTAGLFLLGFDDFASIRPEVVLDLNGLSIAKPKYETEFNRQLSAYTLFAEHQNLDSVVVRFREEMQSLVTVHSVPQIGGVTVNNFADSALTYRVEGVGFNAGVVKHYQVSVLNVTDSCELQSVVFTPEDNPGLLEKITLAKSGQNFTADISADVDVTALVARCQLTDGAILSVNNIVQQGATTQPTDFSNPVLVKVGANGQRRVLKYRIFLDQRSSEAELLNMVIADGQIMSPVFNAKRVTLWMKTSINKKHLTPQFWVSDAATVYVGGIRQRSGLTPNNFARDVEYTVVSEDETVENSWFVTANIDTVFPEIVLIGSDTLTLKLGENYVDPGARATDNLDGDISSKIDISGAIRVRVNKVGNYQVVYKVTDRAGNTTQVNRVIKVQDFTGVKLAQTPLKIGIYCARKCLFVDVPALQKVNVLRIINAQGGVVKTLNTLHQGQNCIPLSLPSGVYFISLELETGFQTSKIVMP